MYNVEFSKEEIDMMILQIGARIDVLKEIQEQCGRKGDVNRVVEMDKGIKVIEDARNKMMSVRYK